MVFVVGAVEVKEISGVEGDVTFSEQDDGQGVGFGFVEALMAAAAEGEAFEDLLEPGEAVVAGAKYGVEGLFVFVRTQPRRAFAHRVFRVVENVVGHLVGNGEGQLFTAFGERDQAEIDSEDVVSERVGIDGGVPVKQKQGVDGDQVAVGVCDLADDGGDIWIYFVIVDVIVVGDGGEQEIGAAVVYRFVLALAVLILEECGADPGFLKGILLFLIVKMGQVLIIVQALVLRKCLLEQAYQDTEQQYFSAGHWRLTF